MPYADDLDLRVGSAAVGASMAVEARYVGSRSLQSLETYNYNEINIVENGFLNEFRSAQSNLTPISRPGAATFPYSVGPGTSPLPIFLAHFNGIERHTPATRQTTAAPTGQNTTFLGYLAKYSPTPYNFANTGTDRLIGNATLRGNALTAGLPANSWQQNPAPIGGAERRRQRRRDVRQLVCSSNSTSACRTDSSSRQTTSTAKQEGTARYSLRYPPASACGTPAPLAASPHAFPATWLLRAAVWPGQALRQQCRPLAQSA